MAIKTYTESEFKAIIKKPFDRIQNIPDEIRPTDSDVTDSFEYATAQLQFDMPTASDQSVGEKYNWLKNRMRSFLFDLMAFSYSSVSDFKDQKSRKIYDGFVRQQNALDDIFNTTYTGEINSTPMVRGSGHTWDEHGNETSHDELNDIDPETGTIEGIDP